MSVDHRLIVIRRLLEHHPISSQQELVELLAAEDIDVTQDADRLSPVGKTMTALARALSQESRVLILDEPTAALTVPVNLAELLDLEHGQAWFGFTAATGALYRG